MIKNRFLAFFLAFLLALSSACGSSEDQPKTVHSDLPGSPPPKPVGQRIATFTVPATLTNTATSKVWTGIGPWVNISDLFVDPSNSGVLYAGTDGAGVYKSIDNGQSWDNINAGLNNHVIWDLAIDPLTPATIYAATDGGVFKTLDGGENWFAVNNEFFHTGVFSVVVDPQISTTIYAVTFLDGVFKSTNAGESWIKTKIALGEDALAIVLIVDPVIPSTVYVGTYNGGVFKSTNGGENWNPINIGINGVYDTPIDQLVLDPHTSGTLYAVARDRNIYKTTDGGQQWNMFETGLPMTTISDPILWIDPRKPKTMYIGTFFGEIFRSTDNGKSWSEYRTGIDNYPVRVFAADPSHSTVLYVGTSGGGVFTNRTDLLFAPALMPSLTSPPEAIPELPLAVVPAPTEFVAELPAVRLPTPVDSRPLVVEDWSITMDSYARDRLEETPLAGLTMAIRRPGEQDWVRAYGFADLNWQIPASPETVYPIGSLSMGFTAVAVLKLQSQGLLNLNVPISQYLDGLPDELQQITLLQLLTHTSGIYDSPFDVQDKFFQEGEFSSRMLLEELVPNLRVDSNDLQERFSYGNYILAGLIIEKVSGLSYPDFMEQYVFVPAGLRHTSYCLPYPDRLATGYYLADGVYETFPLNFSAVFAAGGLCSTAGDLLIWMDALRSGKVISPESFQRMVTPVQLSDGSLSFYGLGFYVLEDLYGLQIGSFGLEASYASFLISYPEKGLTIIMISNTASPGNDFFELFYDHIPLLMQ